VAVFYDDVPRREALPRILSPSRSRTSGARWPSSTSPAPTSPAGPRRLEAIKSDAIHLLDLLESPFAPRNFEIPRSSIGVLWRHTHRFWSG